MREARRDPAVLAAVSRGLWSLPGSLRAPRKRRPPLSLRAASLAATACSSAAASAFPRLRSGAASRPPALASGLQWRRRRGAWHPGAGAAVAGEPPPEGQAAARRGRRRRAEGRGRRRGAARSAAAVCYAVLPSAPALGKWRCGMSRRR